MKWLFLSLIGLWLPMSAVASSLEQALAVCRGEENALKRLVCYDEINLTKQSSLPAQASKGQQQAAASRTKTDGQATEIKAETTASQATERFGLEHKSQPERASALSMTVTKLSHNNRRELIIEFDNGQVWRQQGNSHYPIAVGEQHQIKRGMLGGFSLGNERNNRTIRVLRER